MTSAKEPLVIGFGAKEEFGFAFEMITNKKKGEYYVG
jgi:hypothetical protein